MAVPGSMIRFENKKGDVCRNTMYLLYRLNQGEVVKYVNYCNIHHPNDIEVSDKKIVRNSKKSKKKKSIEDNKVSDNTKGRKLKYLTIKLCKKE